MGTYGTTGSPILIDNAAENIKTISFDTASGNYTLGTTAGNALKLTNGGILSILYTLTAGNITETINAPLKIQTANSGYTLANSGTNATTNLVDWRGYLRSGRG